MLNIRSAQLKDTETLLQTHKEAVFAKAKDYYTQTELEEWAQGVTPDRVKNLQDEISNPDFIVLVAEVGDEIVGFAMAVPLKNEIKAVYTKPNSTGKVGQKLLLELEKQAFAKADFLVCDAALNAESFYAANGYSSEGRYDHVLNTGATVACIRMKKHRTPMKD